MNAAADGALVDIVSVDDPEPKPGVMVPGLKQLVSDGSFEHESITALLNAPKLEPTVIVYVADCPAETAALACERLRH